MLIEAARSVLLVVDLQARLLPAVADAEACLARTRILIEAAHKLDVPSIASEQYPKGLGPTETSILQALGDSPVLPKIHFSCADDPDIFTYVEELVRDTVVICGTEAHVCVLQSALGFFAKSKKVVVVADAVASRDPENKRLALDRMRAAGVVIASSEMVVFEWLHRAGTPVFREVSRLIR